MTTEKKKPNRGSEINDLPERQVSAEMQGKVTGGGRKVILKKAPLRKPVKRTPGRGGPSGIDRG